MATTMRGTFASNESGKIYNIDGEKVIPDGGTPEVPWFFLRGGKLYPAPDNPNYSGSGPVFEVRGSSVYPFGEHPSPSPTSVWYTIS